MASRSDLVNLDAMIKREDFATSETDAVDCESVATISLRDFTSGGLMGPGLSHGDFSRPADPVG